MEQQQVDANFLTEIISTDEAAHFFLSDWLMNKIVAFGARENYERLVRHKCIHNLLLLGADLGLTASLD